MSMSSTVKPRSGRRRVVRRAALDQAYDIALGDLPIEMRPAMIAWVNARRAEHEARSALSTLMTQHHMRWADVEALSRELAFAA